MKSFFRFVGVPAALLLAGPAFAQDAEPQICSNDILGEETITTDLIIQDPGCLLAGTIVQGDVFVEAGANAQFLGANISGSLFATDADRVVSRGTVVGGDIVLTGLVGPRKSEIVENAVGGLIDVTGNAAPVRLLRNTVGLDVLVFENTAGVNVSRNDIGESLICENNEPAPAGAQNLVGVSKEGQCANF
jgi:hypothetical protein